MSATTSSKSQVFQIGSSCADTRQSARTICLSLNAGTQDPHALPSSTARHQPCGRNPSPNRPRPSYQTEASLLLFFLSPAHAQGLSKCRALVMPRGKLDLLRTRLPRSSHDHTTWPQTDRNSPSRRRMVHRRPLLSSPLRLVKSASGEIAFQASAWQ